MNTIITAIKGKKTYLLGACGIIVVALTMTGVIPADIGNQLLTILGFGGLITLRAGITK